MVSALVEVVVWANNNTNELVTVYITDCAGDNCTGPPVVCPLLCCGASICTHLPHTHSHSARAQEGLKQLDIPYIADCSALRSLTLSQAMNFSRLPGGGHVLGIFGRFCVGASSFPFPQLFFSSAGLFAFMTGCMDEQYDPSTECYIVDHLDHVNVCWENKTKAVPFDHMWASLQCK